MTNYKILKVADSVPNTILSKFYVDNNLQELSYEDVIKKYCDNGLILPPSWSICMKQLGNDCINVVPSFLELQKHWCTENNLSFDNNSKDLILDIFLKQIAIIKPDVIFFSLGSYLSIPTNIIKDLKKNSPFIRVVTAFWADYRPSYKYKSVFSPLDIVFTGNSGYKKYMTEAGLKAYSSHCTFDTYLYNIINKKQNKIDKDFVFAGSTGYRCNLHVQRYEILKQLLEETNIKCWSSESSSLRKEGIQSKIRLKSYTNKLLTNLLSLIGTNSLNIIKDGISSRRNIDKFTRLNAYTYYTLERAIEQNDVNKNEKNDLYTPFSFPTKYKPLNVLYPSRFNAGLYGVKYYELLASSKIIFNAHRDEPIDTSMRIFEATGVGSLLITDHSNAVREFFMPDEEILTYSNIDECIEKVNYVLGNEKARKEIALKGQARTMKEYTTMNQCEKVHQVIQKYI